MAKHEAWELRQMQSLPLEAKIRMTQRRIQDWYEYWDGMVHISFSGGKDSTVLKHIVDQMYDDVPAVFVNTGLEYPEIRKFAMSQKNVVKVSPEMRFDEVIKKHGYPVGTKRVAHYVDIIRRNPYSVCKKYLNGEKRTKFVTARKWVPLLEAPFTVSEKCCDVMKHNPINQYQKQTGRKAIVGTMAAESLNREMAWINNGCNAFESKNPTSQPLSFWTEQDVLQYLKKYDVPFCSVYGNIVVDDDKQINGQITTFDILGNYEGTTLKTTGCNRTGCIFCMFGCHLEKEPNRFQRLKETHPRQYEYCIGGGEMVDGKWQPSKEGLGIGKVLDYIGVKY